MRAFHTREKLEVELTQTELELILSIFPQGASVQGAEYFDNYDLPCPVKVTVRMPSGETTKVVCRRTRRPGADATVVVERLLLGAGLPVPEILAGPEDGCVVVSFLEGEDLQHFSMRSSENVEIAKQLLCRAFETLGSMTKIVKSAKLVETRSLADELDQIPIEGPWSSDSLFREGRRMLRPVVDGIKTPLSFTNGDHQPANFLTNGEEIVGFLDFEGSCIRDPLMGIAKYPVYDLHPLNKAGFADYYLEQRGFTHTDFASRLAIMCLSTLQEDIPIRVESDEQQRYQQHVLSLLNRSLDRVGMS